MTLDEALFCVVLPAIGFALGWGVGRLQRERRRAKRLSVDPVAIRRGDSKRRPTP